MTSLNLRIDADLKRDLEAAAAADRRTLTATVEIALESFLRGRRGGPEPAAPKAKAGRA